MRYAIFTILAPSKSASMVRARPIDDALYGQGKVQWNHPALSCPRRQKSEEVLTAAAGTRLVHTETCSGGA